MIDPNEKNPLREQQERKVAELALMFAIPVITNAVGNSRLDGLQRKLQTAAIDRLRRARSMNNDVLVGAIDKIRDWGNNSGWSAASNHHDALISFCLVIIDESPIDYGPKITKILNDISDHLENGGVLMTKAMLGGEEAAENWAETYAK
jgi:hypothetical protein